MCVNILNKAVVNPQTNAVVLSEQLSHKKIYSKIFHSVHVHPVKIPLFLFNEDIFHLEGL